MNHIINKNFQINWEDEDSNSQNLNKTSHQHNHTNEFSTLLNSDTAIKSMSQNIIQYKPKQKVTGKIIAIGDGNNNKDVLIELAGKYVGILSKEEIYAPNGNIEYKIGDQIEAVVVNTKDNEVYLSKSLALSLKTKEELYIAYQNKTPIKGKVTEINKGGFEINILGYKMFCPVSQIDIKRVEDKEKYIGKEYDFIIEHFNPPNDMIVSRVQALKLLQKAKIKILYDEYTKNPFRIYEATVTAIKKGGILIDVGGISGFIPNSELGWGKMLQGYKAISISIGDLIKAILIKIEDIETNNPKLIFSMKQASQDPWETVHTDFKIEQTYWGIITHIERYGVFVELKPGIEGLVHIQEIITEKKIKHPSEIFKLGEQIEVKILSIDPINKKISLSFKNKKHSDTEEDIPKEFIDQPNTNQQNIGGLGKALLKALKHKNNN